MFQLRLGKIVKAFGISLEPLVDLVRRSDVLIDIAGFVAQVEHHPVLDRLIEAVSVDVRAEHLKASCFVVLEQWGACEADEHGVGQDRLHRLVQFPRLGAMALIDEYIDVSLRIEPGGQRKAHFLDKAFHISFGVFLASKLVDQRAK